MKLQYEKMKKKLLVLAIIILLAVISFSGCTSSVDKFSAKSLNLTLKDLPTGYIECNHDDNNQDLFVLAKPKESYRIVFFLGDCTNWSKGVDSIIAIFDSTDESIDFFNFSSNIFRGPEVKEAKNILGDESYGIEIENANITIGYALCFRISNIVTAVSYLNLDKDNSFAKDYSFAFNLSKTVEQRIYNSMK
jgi:hypothetical protein